MHFIADYVTSSQHDCTFHFKGSSKCDREKHLILASICSLLADWLSEAEILLDCRFHHASSDSAWLLFVVSLTDYPGEWVCFDSTCLVLLEFVVCIQDVSECIMSNIKSANHWQESI